MFLCSLGLSPCVSVNPKCLAWCEAASDGNRITVGLSSQSFLFLWMKDAVPSAPHSPLQDYCKEGFANEYKKLRFSHALEGKWKHLSFSLLAVDSCSLLQLSVCHWHKELLQKWSSQCLLQGCEREGKTLSHGGGRRVGATQRTFGSLSGKWHLKSL